MTDKTDKIYWNFEKYDPKVHPDGYISNDLPINTTARGKFMRIVYGEAVDTQPACPRCGRPMFYALNKRTGKPGVICDYCDEGNPDYRR